MRRGRMFFFIAFILILGLVGVLLVWRFFLSAPSQPEGPTPTPTLPPVEVVVMAQNVTKGTELQDAMLTTIPWQQSAIAPGMFTNEQLPELIGRVPKYDLAAGTPLLDTMLLKQGETIPSSGSPWALSIPTGMVAVAVPVTRLSSVAYAPRPGDHVNVIATMLFVDVDTDFQTSLPNSLGELVLTGPPDPETGEPTIVFSSTGSGLFGKIVIDPVLGQAIYVIPSEQQRPRMVSQMILQDVIVLQMGNFPLPGEAIVDPNAAPTPTPEGAQPAQQQQAPPAPPPAPDVVTLIVRPQDAVTLNYLMIAQTHLATQLSLVLRGSTDASRENILPVTLGFLLDQYQIPVPAKLPYSLNPRIDAVEPVPIINQPEQ